MHSSQSVRPRRALPRSLALAPVSLLFLLVAVLSLVQPARAATLRGQVQLNDLVKDIGQLGHQTRFRLQRIPAAPEASAAAHGQVPESLAEAVAAASIRSGSEERETYQTFMRRDGVFVFTDVAPGAYLLKIDSRWHAFRQYRIDVSEAEEQGVNVGPDFRSRAKSPIKIRTYMPGTPLSATLANPPLPSPFMIQPLAAYDFFTEPEPFNIKGLLANPMMLIAIAGGVLVFLMPKLMASLDPESLAELNEQQAAMQAKMNAFQNGDLQSLFKDDSKGSGPGTATSPAKQAQGGGTKKRR